MAINLRNRNFLKELDFTKEEFVFLLKLSAQLKAAKYGGYEQPRLRGKNLALIFEKTSTHAAPSRSPCLTRAHVTYPARKARRSGTRNP